MWDEFLLGEYERGQEGVHRRFSIAPSSRVFARFAPCALTWVGLGSRPLWCQLSARRLRIYEYEKGGARDFINEPRLKSWKSAVSADFHDCWRYWRRGSECVELDRTGFELSSERQRRRSFRLGSHTLRNWRANCGNCVSPDIVGVYGSHGSLRISDAGECGSNRVGALSRCVDYRWRRCGSCCRGCNWIHVGS